MTTDRMQARRDAFLMLTDETPPDTLPKWLVVWDEQDGMAGWRTCRDEHTARIVASAGGAKVYDLDNQ